MKNYINSMTKLIAIETLYLKGGVDLERIIERMISSEEW